MTTIVYSHAEKIIAYDSRLTRHGTICTDDDEKSVTVNGVTFVMCGSVAGQQKFIQDYPDTDVDFDYECNGVIVKDGKVYSFCVPKGKKHEEFELTFSEAWGSGSDHALTALDCGLTAVEAIEAAKKRCNATGGRVRTIDVSELMSTTAGV